MYRRYTVTRDVEPDTMRQIERALSLILDIQNRLNQLAG
jgi:hypothetical protein